MLSQSPIMDLFPQSALVSNRDVNNISIRDEFNKTIHGFVNEIGVGMPILIRRMRRDLVTFAKTKCTCVDPITHEPDLDTICTACLGDGFYWDEEWYYAYKRSAGSETSLGRREEHLQAGSLRTQLYKFYLDYQSNLLDGDSIIELVLDIEGNIAKPARRLIKWSPKTIEVKRLDNGRIEYYIATCQASNIILIDKYNLSYVENP